MADPLLTLLGLRIAVISVLGILVMALPLRGHVDPTCRSAAVAMADVSASPDATGDADLREMHLHD